MRITNLIIDKISTNRDPQPGQVWLNTATNKTYFLTRFEGWNYDMYVLVDMSSGTVINDTTDIKDIFRDEPNDFRQVDTELVIRGLI